MNTKAINPYKKSILCMLVLTLVLWACGSKNIPTQSRHWKAANKDMIEGNTWYMKGCMSKAAGYFDKALERFSAYDDQEGVAKCLNNLGSIYRIQKDRDTALLFFDEAKRIFSELQHPLGQIQALSNKAAVFIDMEQYDKASSVLDQADTLAGSLTLLFPSLLSNRALILIHQKNYEKAQILLDRARLTISKDKPFEEATLLHVTGVLMENMEKYDEALGHYASALETDRREYFLRGIAADLTAMGRVYIAQGQHGKALFVLYRSMKVRSLLGDGSESEDTSALLKTCLSTLGPKAPDTRITDLMLNQWAKGDTLAAPCE